MALFVTISSGLSMGANVLIARHIGEGAPEKIRKRFPCALTLSLTLGILALLTGESVTSLLLRQIHTPAAIFDQAATTYTSQNFAAGNGKRCRSILRCCLILSILCCSLITLPLSVFPHFFAGLFTTSPAVADAACLRIRYILLFEPICCLYEIPGGILRGTGHAALPAVFTVLGTCLLRIGWILTVFSAHPSLPILFVIFPVSWVVTILLINVGLTVCHKDW